MAAVFCEQCFHCYCKPCSVTCHKHPTRRDHNIRKFWSAQSSKDMSRVVDIHAIIHMYMWHTSIIDHRKSITVARRVSTYCSYCQNAEFLALLLTSSSTECIDIRAAVSPPALTMRVYPFCHSSRCMLIGALPNNLNWRNGLSWNLIWGTPSVIVFLLLCVV